MQAGEDDLDDRHALFGMQAHRDAPAIVGDLHAAVAQQPDIDVPGKAAQRLVGRVVDDFLDDVQRVFRAGVHARPLADGFQPLQYPDGGFRVGGAVSGCG